MKKLSVLFLITAMGLSMIACSNKTVENKPTETTVEKLEETVTETEETSEEVVEELEETIEIVEETSEETGKLTITFEGQEITFPAVIQDFYHLGWNLAEGLVDDTYIEDGETFTLLLRNDRFDNSIYSEHLNCVTLYCVNDTGEIAKKSDCKVTGAYIATGFKTGNDTWDFEYPSLNILGLEFGTPVEEAFTLLGNPESLSNSNTSYTALYYSNGCEIYLEFDVDGGLYAANIRLVTN